MQELIGSNLHESCLILLNTDNACFQCKSQEGCEVSMELSCYSVRCNLISSSSPMCSRPGALSNTREPCLTLVAHPGGASGAKKHGSSMRRLFEALQSDDAPLRFGTWL